MSKKSKHINVRFDSELYDVVEQIAKENRMSKSDVVRTAIEGELANISEHRNRSLSDAERETIIRDVGRILTFLSRIEAQNRRLGNNVNQIARAMNKGQKGVSQIELDEYEKYRHWVERNIKAMSKAVDKLWRILA